MGTRIASNQTLGIVHFFHTSCVSFNNPLRNSLLVQEYSRTTTSLHTLQFPYSILQLLPWWKLCYFWSNGLCLIYSLVSLHRIHSGFWVSCWNVFSIIPVESQWLCIHFHFYLYHRCSHTRDHAPSSFLDISDTLPYQLSTMSSFLRLHCFTQKQSSLTFLTARLASLLA